MANGKMSKDEKRWQAEDDLRTMKRMHEIKNDPKRMKEMKKVAEAEIKALKTVTKK